MINYLIEYENKIITWLYGRGKSSVQVLVRLFFSTYSHNF